jgi:hypothetical protein
MSKLIHVRLLYEGQSWVAQSLEYDITGQGKTELEALENWRKTMQGTIALNKRDGKEPFADLPCAPTFYWLGIDNARFAGVEFDPEEITLG